MFETSILFTFGKLAGKLMHWAQLFFVKILKLSQSRMLNNFIQQGFCPWYKVNWVKNFLKCRSVASLESCQRSVMEVFYEIGDFFWLFVTFAKTLQHTCFVESQMHCCGVQSIWYSVHNRCMPFKKSWNGE